MKYIVVLGDGMADYPLPELGYKTPMQCAYKPAIDGLARQGITGIARTIPEGMLPGSDTANLSVFGYDPRRYYRGRSPFEAISMGIQMADADMSLRCNMVTLSDDEPYEQKTMLDYCAGEITSGEAEKLIGALNEHLGSDVIRFYPGISYRHLIIWQGSPFSGTLIPPHDIIGKKIADYLPSGHCCEVIAELMKKSHEILRHHPVNQSRKSAGLPPANAAWIWGEGKRPELTFFSEKYALRGAVVAAVDLIRGIGICAGLDIINVPGATGNINTNFRGKAEAALFALKNGYDFVYIHIGAPDECAHRFEIDNKVKAIELIDEKVVGYLKTELEFAHIDFRMMILPDHYTPLSLRTHTSDPVPFLIYDSCNLVGAAFSDIIFDEENPKLSGLEFADGYRLMDYFINNTKE